MSNATAVDTAEALFPEYKGRRLPFDQPVGDVAYFTKYSGSRVDYSVDLTHRLSEVELVTAAYSETDSANLLIPVMQRFDRGVTCFLEGGVNGITYRLTITVTTDHGRALTFYADITCYGGADELDTFYRFPLMGAASDPAQNYLTDVLGKFTSPTWVNAVGALLGDGTATNDYGNP